MIWHGFSAKGVGRCGPLLALAMVMGCGEQAPRLDSACGPVQQAMLLWGQGRRAEARSMLEDASASNPGSTLARLLGEWRTTPRDTYAEQKAMGTLAVECPLDVAG